MIKKMWEGCVGKGIKWRFGILVCLIFGVLSVAYMMAALINYGMEGDEVFSYISSTSMGGYKGICYLEDQTWYDADYFRSALTADGEERFNYGMVVENQAMDTHPPFYYLLLNFIISLFPGYFSRWFGIGLNIFLMFFVWAGLYLLIEYFLHRRYPAAFFATLFCCARGTFSLVLFIRMYVLLMAVSVFQSWYHLKLWDRIRAEGEMPYGKNRKWWVILAVLTIIGAWTHYYFIIYQCLIAGVFCASLLFQKKYLAMLRYMGCMAASAVFYILLYPAALTHLFFKYRGRDAVHKFLKGSSLMKEVWSMLGSYSEGMFHEMLLPIGGILAIGTIWLLVGRRIRAVSVFRGFLLMTPACMHFFIISKASPFIAVRYIAPVMPVFFAAIMILAYQILKRMRIEKKTRCILAGVLSLMLIPICAYLWQSPLKELFYAEKRNVIYELSEKSDYCVYVTGDEYNWKMWEDYIYYPLFDGLYFIDGNKKKPIEDPTLSAGDSLVVFIDSALNAEEILEYLGEFLPHEIWEPVYQAQYQDIYFAHRSG